MLVRMFRGRAHRDKLGPYSRYLREVAAPHILAYPGVRGVRIYDPVGDAVEFLVESVWEDVPSLIAFAGPQWCDPRILPAERDMVASAAVSHYRPGRRFSGAPVTTKRIAVEPAAGIARVDGEVYELPPLEGRLLAELARRPGDFVDPAELARTVWRGSAAIAPNDVRRAVYRLRKLIDDDLRRIPAIQSRRGYGYKLDA